MLGEAILAAQPWQMWATFALVVFAVASFCAERVPLEVTAVAILAALLVLFHLAPLTDEAGASRLDAARLLGGFANPGLITVVALLVIGQALIQTGALESVANLLHHISRGRLLRALTMSLLPVSAFSSVLNNTPVVVIFIPIMSALAERLRISTSRVLMPLSFAAILGGMTTLIGSSTNLLVAGTVVELGLPQIGFFDFLVPGLVLAAIGLAYLLLVAPWLMPDRASLAGRLAGAGRQFIAQIAVPPDSPLVGERPVAGMFRKLPDITVRTVQRGEHAFLPPFDDVALRAGDVIVAAATRKALTGALARHPDALHPSLTHRQFAASEEPWRGGEQALAEAMVVPGSRIIGQTLEQFGFRHRFRCIVLGVQRRSRMLRQRLTDIRLEAGDVLLIQGRPDDVTALRASRDVVLIEWSQESLPRYFHARRAAVIFAAVVLLAATGAVPIVVAAVLGAAAMLLAGCLNVRQAGRAIDRAVVMTVAAALALGAALQETGGAHYLAGLLIDALGEAGPAVILSALFLLIALVTNLLTNNAAAVLFTPIAVSLAVELGVDATAFVHAVIFAASCSFASPIGYQTNLMVMAPGHYRFADYGRVGGPLMLVVWASFSLLAPVYYDL
jgi:di/tricarboxylate transporter